MLGSYSQVFTVCKDHAEKNQKIYKDNVKGYLDLK